MAWRAFARSFWLSPRRYPDFGWAWLTRFAISLGNAMAMLYLLYFLRDRLHYSRLFPGHKAEHGLLILILIYSAGVTVTAVASGVISDRTGRRKLAGHGLRPGHGGPRDHARVLATWPVAIAAAAIMGLGFGVYLSVDAGPGDPGAAVGGRTGQGPWPDQHRQLRAAVLAPAIAAPLVSELGGYRALYLSVAVITVVGLGLRPADPLRALTCCPVALFTGGSRWSRSPGRACPRRRTRPSRPGRR